MDVIVKANGEPYSRAQTARQQLSAKALLDTHTVRRHAGGWAIVPKQQIQPEDRVTLQPGDYCLTEGMSEEEYHAVAKAFMVAGSPSGEYPNISYIREYGAVGWANDGDGVYHQSAGFCVFDRELTVSQILNATNANPATETTPKQEPTMHPIDTLKTKLASLRTAQEQFDEALKEARTAYPELVIDVRSDDVAIGYNDDGDLSDPANWRAGDLFEVIKEGSRGELLGAVIAASEPHDTNMGMPAIAFFNGESTRWILHIDVKFHSRPTK